MRITIHFFIWQMCLQFGLCVFSKSVRNVKQLTPISILMEFISSLIEHLLKPRSKIHSPRQIAAAAARFSVKLSALKCISAVSCVCFQAGEAAQTETVSEENKSLIWTLLKQVRPGMDLSKVVLPTFILEPRSFLDKLSDYYYHADFLSE